MRIIRSPEEIRRETERFRTRGMKIGFVPTMGALHAGHLSLVRKARKENRVVVVSIFVNPLQFGPGEDYRHYPRPLERDRRLLEKEKVDLLFLPSSRALYPSGSETFVEVAGLSRGLCGRFRPGHFRGVATVVTKLFNLVRPHRAYFGAKDYQQALLLKRLALDLNFDIEVKILPLVRDRDGLALSSRNAYLSSAERSRALSLPHSLFWAKMEIRGGNRSLRALRNGVLKRLRQGLARVEYAEFADPKTLKSVTSLQGPVLLAVAGWVGKTRLIDNVIIRP
jgi:pantoate--beta-alanine ligase